LIKWFFDIKIRMWEFGGVEYAGKGEMVNENNDIKIS
jgi:hypothetical protein